MEQDTEGQSGTQICTCQPHCHTRLTKGNTCKRTKQCRANADKHTRDHCPNP
jgi:hypothetical protein